MKKLGATFFFITSLIVAADQKVPSIYVQEESENNLSGATNRIATGNVDCATNENFKRLLENGQYDLCRAYLAGKTPTEITLLKIKYGDKKIDWIMGELYALSSKKEAKLTDEEKNFLNRGGYASFPLHTRAFFGDEKAVDWFLKQHPQYDTSTTTVTGYTASDVARQEGYTAIADKIKPVGKRSVGTFIAAKSRFVWVFLFLLNAHLLCSIQT